VTLSPIARQLIGFGPHLRRHGFAVATGQLIDFLRAIALLGPNSIEDIRRAAVAVLVVSREREDEFNALFDAYFLGFGLALPETDQREDESVEAHEPTGMQAEALETEDERPAGERAASAERLTQRSLAEEDDDRALAAFERVAPRQLPSRKSYRKAAARRGQGIDLRRTLRLLVRSGGEVVALIRQRRVLRHRRILLLIDVSGSMKEHTEQYMRFAHALTMAGRQVEVFALGTRLTRISDALRIRSRQQALRAVSLGVADIDGGTRIGEALQALLSVPRYLGFARGAFVIVLSDGLERGGHERMVDATRQLAALAWRISWLSPLATGDEFRPQTQALMAASQHLDSMGRSDRLEEVASHVLNAGKAG